MEVCRRLKGDKATAHIPVVLVTALDQPSDRMHGLDAGADDFLSKPIDEIALLARIHFLSRLRLILDELRSRAPRSSKLGIGDPFTRATADKGTGGRIMLIEDSPASAEFIKNALRKHHSIELERDRGRALDSGAARNYDLFIVSLDLADCDGLRFCTRLRLRGLDLGVNDYVLRPVDRDELSARVRTQIRRKRYADCLHNNVEATIEMAAADPLTGLKNRRCLETHLGTLLDSSCGGPLSAMILDLDGFKAINDRYGHDAGDRVLRSFAARAKEMIRETDLVCRLGGDEFVNVMPGTGLHGGLEIAERIRAAIASDGFAVAAGGRPIAVTVSAGLAESTGGLLHRALAPRRQGALPVETGRTQSRFGRSCGGLIARWPAGRWSDWKLRKGTREAGTRRSDERAPYFLEIAPRARRRGRYRHDRRVKGSAIRKFEWAGACG